MFEEYVSIVIPVYNEEKNLVELQQELESFLDTFGHPWEVIYIDDGSQDRSYEHLLEFYARRPDVVRLVRLRRNFGQTAALAAGLDVACGDWIIPMDADLQNDPADIGRLLEEINKGYDVVSGWRFKRKDKFFSRRLPSMIANYLISLITGVHLHDYGCSLKALRREVVDDIHLYGELHRFLPALASWSGARVTEIKVNHRPRKYGKTKYGIDRTMHVILDLITVKFMLSYSTNPMQVFGKWGSYSIFVSFISGLATIFLKVLPPHKDVTGNPWMYICFFFMLGGLQFICLGLLAEINVRTYYESQHKRIYTVQETHGVNDKVNETINKDSCSEI